MGGALKSLSDLKSSPDVGLPERTVTVCVSAKLAAELDEATREAIDAAVALDQAREDARARTEGEAPPLRSGQSSPVTKAEKAAEAAAKRADEVRDRIKDASVELLLRAKTAGEWRRWASVHPARDEGEPGHEFDLRWAAGFCDLDALISALPEYVAAYNGEESSDEWAEFVAANGVPADLRNAASVLVGMHEQGVDLGKSRAAWLRDRRSSATSN